MSLSHVPGVYNPPVHKQHMMSEKPWSIMSPLSHTNPTNVIMRTAHWGKYPGVSHPINIYRTGSKFQGVQILWISWLLTIHKNKP